MRNNSSFKMAFCILALLGLFLVGCGGDSSAAAQPTATKAPTATRAPAPKTAEAIVQSLKSLGLPLGESFTYTADNDQNHLLGRPGQYTGKANWIDTRLTSTNTGVKISVTDGGSVETFASLDDASKRFSYIQSLSTSGNALFAEYEYQHGAAILRVSSALTPAQAQAYDDAFKKTMG